jgi:hypothetical protein
MQDIIKTPESYNSELVLIFQLEGKFSNSNNKEIIAFYQWRDTLQYNALDKAFYFILDNSGNKINNAFAIPYYVTGPFNETFNLDLMPIEILGKKIEWMGYSIGRIGDFNENGRDELYLFSLSGIGFTPFFFEFDIESNEFKEILNYRNRSGNVEIVDINVEQKKILFHDRSADNVSSTDEIIAYQWDEEVRAYVEVEEYIGDTEVAERESIGVPSEQEQLPPVLAPADPVAPVQATTAPSETIPGSRRPVPFVALAVGLFVFSLVVGIVLLKKKSDRMSGRKVKN